MNSDLESALALPIALILVVVLGWMASDAWTNEVDRLETQWEQQLLGNRLDGIELAMAPTLSSDALSESNTNPKVSLRSLQTMMSRVSHRLALQGVWFPATVIFFLALLHDAVQARHIARHQFSYTSPRLHQGARRLFKGGFMSFTSLMLAPVPVHPIFAWLVSILILLPLHALIIHSPKRL